MHQEVSFFQHVKGRHFSRYLFWLWILLVSLHGQAQILPAPAWQCIQSQTNAVELHWTPLNDPNGNFIRYEIHSLTDGLIASETNINTSNYTHVGATTVKSYFLKTISNGGETNSDTVQNIVLTLNNPGNGTAILSWNDPGKNISVPFSDQAFIYRTDGSGGLSLRDSVLRPTSLYRDTIDICQATMEYQIRIPGNSCMFTSVVRTDYFEDKTTPYIPDITTASIDTASGELQLTWDANGARDTYGYIIYKRNQNGILIEIDTVWGRFNTAYSYLENTSSGPLSYSIAAFDSCFTQSVPPTYQTSAKGNVKTTTFLQGDYDACLGMVHLNWTPYTHFGNNPNITVFYLENGIWKDEPATTNNSHNIVFTQSGTYWFIVRYKASDGREIFSNKIQIQTDSVNTTNANYLSAVSVDGSETELIHYIDPPSAASAIAFSRQQNDGSFKEIGRVNVDDEWTTFVDTEAQTGKVNVYTCNFIDQCGNKLNKSNNVSTIYTRVESNEDDYSNQISWTPYVGFDGSISGYEIYRVVDGVTDPSPISTVPSNIQSIHDVLDDVRVKETICYRVVAIESTNSYGFAQWAGSNNACGSFESKIFTPNAFSPDGANPKFAPVFSFNEYLTFELRIFNRWGKLIYQTSDPHEGWDGTNQSTGKKANPEVYSYWFKFVDLNEKEVIRQGHVTLIR